MTEHCYIWLPQIRTFQTHPFTIVSTEPLEVVVNSRDGFTKALNQYAASNPGASLRASVEGPYGTIPDPMSFDKVVLIAGGSGATFAFGMAIHMAESMIEQSNKQIELIWASRGQENLTWFTRQLNHLASHHHASKISIQLYLTRAVKMSANSSVTQAPILTDNEESFAIDLELSSRITSEKSQEKIQAMETSRNVGYLENSDSVPLRTPFTPGRPDIQALIEKAVSSTPKDQRILIAACGPQGLLGAVRNAASSCIDIDGPAIELHCEEFGW
ncbi:ferric reductase NAD binding domain-containing protein [Xylariaceae sp. FL0255]|nr:ferric reductase NAD binding domain-containing protein [Xylariaceae sp. FL0255]